jgi:hypothetical protein
MVWKLNPKLLIPEISTLNSLIPVRGDSLGVPKSQDSDVDYEATLGVGFGLKGKKRLAQTLFVRPINASLLPFGEPGDSSTHPQTLLL